MILIDRKREKFEMDGGMDEVATDLGYAAAEMKAKLMESGMRKEAAEKVIMLAINAGFQCADEEQNT